MQKSLQELLEREAEQRNDGEETWHFGFSNGGGPGDDKDEGDERARERIRDDNMREREI